MSTVNDWLQVLKEIEDENITDIVFAEGAEITADDLKAVVEISRKMKKGEHERTEYQN